MTYSPICRPSWTILERSCQCHLEHPPKIIIHSPQCTVSQSLQAILVHQIPDQFSRLSTLIHSPRIMFSQMLCQALSVGVFKIIIFHKENMIPPVFSPLPMCSGTMNPICNPRIGIRIHSTPMIRPWICAMIVRRNEPAY